MKLGLLPCDATASQNQGRGRAESVDEARSVLPTDTATVTNVNASEGAESVGEAWSLAVRRNSLTEQGRGRAESVDEARSPAD